MTNARVVLASGSRTRRQLLMAAGVDFTVVPSAIDEAAVTDAFHSGRSGIDPRQLAETLARAKAEDVSKSRPDCLVIGADQVLAINGTVMTKPIDLAAARETLLALRGRPHVLYSAVAIATGGAVTWSTVDSARLRVRQFSERFLADYLARGGLGLCESVGAYQLEGLGAQLLDGIEGDYFTILGLPLLPLLEELRQRGAIAA